MEKEKIAKVLVVFGTRPEAIKMAPVVKGLKRAEGFDTRVCLTGQHREMLDQVMKIFGLTADFDLEVMSSNQTLTGLTCKVLQGMQDVFAQWKPDCVLVQGDTTTVFAAALAAFYEKIDVGHVEAGLRTGCRYSPFPEEMNRCLASRLSMLHFAPTELAKQNLLKENVAVHDVFVTGNTVVDALFDALSYIDGHDQLPRQFAEKFDFLHPQKRLILVTGHRRENFGEGFLDICHAIRELARRESVQIVYPVHLNPNVRKPVNEILKGEKDVHLIEPLDYLAFIYLMRRSYLILTDSGGVQEEAPSLGKPVLVMRDTTERPEAVEAGTVVLVGPHRDKIAAYAKKLLDDDAYYESMARAHNPYGDGRAAGRIVEVLKQRYLYH
ncbi:non-hydrolyzing UDP-N-acetylglucosamine 2-epimerase [Desulforhabdus sp. TSK]|uniref:non-hydrolyzing UDP-N-acetylglucosamine 2-epimerase n=1 Tax=Desulforhabdus sp. TSK TaxID=2925014 RepID=UPI002082604B|nr:UDP-N-acetylglucosamine 2-epimerase (non-hydrolyzing) [Desulforhabdus sp. TSK]GKT10719.1 UDP-N-acetylglucosamine 2-epimerase [Desulforhabdus sp. TSK]